MKHGYRRLAGAAGLFLALSAVLLSGCNWRKSAPERKDQAGDLLINLGPNAKLPFVWIEPLKLFVGKYEVSNRQYRRFQPDHNSGYHKQLELGEGDQPVVNVNWDDAQQFCQWLNTNYSLAGTKRYHFRLPTEKEWETFAACGPETEYPWGPNWPPPKDWNYFGRENPEFGQKLDNNDGFQVSCPVLKSGQNAWRLFGVGGNVWEWCEDTEGESKSRVFKGASWADCNPYFLKLSRRSSNVQNYRYVTLGFRVVADISNISVEEQNRLKAEQQRKEAEAKAAAAAKARQEAETAQQTANKKEQAERARQEKQTVDQTLIRGLIADTKFDLAAAQLVQYEKDFGKDAFSKELTVSLENTRALNLSAAVSMEFVRVKPLNLWIGKYEVTNKQFREFQPAHNSGMFKEWSLDDPGQPVVNVNWNDAMAFCQWLNTRLAANLEPGREFRLLTEAEWETAATCGQTRDYPWGNQWPPKYGNYGLIEGYDDGAPVTCPVDESGQNEWGLYGMGGNVWEWCADLYDSYRQYRVIRGAAWNLAQADALKITNRTGDSESQENNYIGFRVVIGNKGGAPK